ncbi:MULTISPECIES: class I adenylate-forming enzyme family protein [unclassified Streptomyces]|uniref:class I adenylate-forming enzyme family protein n=1 Tax=unclassified Streptomyces TaxID=2593676 RepID=UPI002E28C193|nr:class I adenylate-forming enzyme family protein [Streptomyces sp. NBC_00223]
MLADVLTEHLGRHRDRTAVTDRHTSLSYADLLRAAGQAADEIRRRTAGRDRPRVGITARNSASYLVAYVGAVLAGAVPLLIDAATGDTELARLDEDCTPDLLVHDRAPGPADLPLPGAPGLAVTVRPERARAYPMRDDTAVCRFTSGTTGKPNCIEFSGRAVHAAAANWAAGTGLSGEDRIICFAGLSNGLAFNTSLLAAFLTGARLHLPHGLPTAGRVSRELRGAGATRLVAFPALYDAIARRDGPDDAFAGIRQAISSGAPLSAATAARFHEVTGLVIADYYGIAETGPLTFAAEPGPGAGLGSPLPGVVLRAGDGGAPAGVRVRSESMASRYLNAPGLLESRIGADGLYDTGDQGVLRDGRLFLTARSTRMVNVAGRKIDPVEVAGALREIPGVDDAVVLEAVDRHGQTALGAVVASAVLDTAAVRAAARDRLTAHKVPSLLRVVPRIPAGAIGKPSMAELRSLLGEKTEPAAVPGTPPGPFRSAESQERHA